MVCIDRVAQARVRLLGRQRPTTPVVRAKKSDRGANPAADIQQQQEAVDGDQARFGTSGSLAAASSL